MNQINPILCEMIRGDLVESFCRGAYAIVNSQGEILDYKGDIQRYIFVRSSLKPLQALSICTTGAYQEQNLSYEHIAFACSSHNAEEAHIKLAYEWLHQINLSEDVFTCGASFPFHAPTKHNLLRQQKDAKRIYHMCSGKHLGFLSCCVNKKWDIENYTDWDHPVQVHTRDVLSELSKVDHHQAPRGIDGCQAPVTGWSLENFAYALAKTANPLGLSPTLQTATQHICQALQQHPYYLAGSNRFCTNIIEETKGTVLVKMGAEGVFSGIVPHKGIGIALKIDDGHMLGAEVAMAKILYSLGLITKENIYLNLPVLNSNNIQVGNWR